MNDATEPTEPVQADAGQSVERLRRVHITVQDPEGAYSVWPPALQDFAQRTGLEAAAPGRVSWLLVFQAMDYMARFDVDPRHVRREIEALEGRAHSQHTKPATPFKADGALAGLWHKHYTSGSVGMIAANVRAANPRAVLESLISEEWGDQPLDRRVIGCITARVMAGYERRAQDSRLTGEWIVYAQHNELNHYLCLATHRGGGAEVLRYLRIVREEYPWLRNAPPDRFAQRPCLGGGPA